MVSHTQIIGRINKSDGALAAILGVKAHRVRDWRLRNSIPAEQWKAFAEHDFATLDELADAAAMQAGEAA